MNTKIKGALVEASFVATLVSLIMVLIEAPVGILYLVLRWTTAFLGAVLGIMGWWLLRGIFRVIKRRFWK